MNTYIQSQPTRALSRRQLLVLSAVAAASARTNPARALERGDGISHTAESIHQQPVFHAGRQRLYQSLTDAKEFEKFMLRSDATRSNAVAHAAPQIDARAGGAFALFGGYISGRFIELVPDTLIVQAWRAGSWAAGIYSIARFDLREDAGQSKILFDHTGFPVGQAEHLAAGWYANYWTPMREVLA